MGGGHTAGTGGQVDRVPGLRHRFGSHRKRGADEARAARRVVQRLPHRVLHQDGPGAARRVDQSEGARHRRGPGDHPGVAADHHRLRLHLVARRQARSGRQAAGAAGVGGVDLRGQRGDRGGGRRAGQARATRLRRIAGDRVRAAVDLPAALAGRRASASPTRSPAPGSAATSTPRPRSRRRAPSQARTRCRSRRSSRPPRTR